MEASYVGNDQILLGHGDDIAFEAADRVKDFSNPE